MILNALNLVYATLFKLLYGLLSILYHTSFNLGYTLLNLKDGEDKSKTSEAKSKRITSNY